MKDIKIEKLEGFKDRKVSSIGRIGRIRRIGRIGRIGRIRRKDSRLLFFMCQLLEVVNTLNNRGLLK